MSKYIKHLLMDHMRVQWQGVEAAVLVNVNGMESNANYRLRKELREKNIHLMVVKNALARLAADGTPLAPAFEGLGVPTAVVWGGDDVVSLAKEVVRLSKVDALAPFAPTGGVMDGERLSADQVVDVSKWPSRREQLALLVGQILAPGANLVSQILAPGGALASQIKQKGEGEESPPEAEPAAAGPAATEATPAG